MSGIKTTSITIKVDLTLQEKDRAKKLAKSKGMTFQGFAGKLIRAELKKAEAANGTRN